MRIYFLRFNILDIWKPTCYVAQTVLPFCLKAQKDVSTSKKLLPNPESLLSVQYDIQ